MKEIILNGKKAAGRVALVDDEDYQLVSQYKWHILEEKRPGRLHGPYAVSSIKRADGSGTTIRMHCLILGATNIDHRDGNGLNNQRSNLRIATDTQNKANGYSRSGTSKFKGVYRSKYRWIATIRINGKTYYIGSFTVEEDAACAYDTAARKAWGEFARLNFAGPNEQSALGEGN